MAHLPEEGRRSNEEFFRDLEALLGELDERLRQMRIAQAQALCLHAAADRERTVASGADTAPFDLFVSSLLDGLTGFLSAPASDATLRRLGSAGNAVPRRLRLL